MWITNISSPRGKKKDTDILENGEKYSNSGHFPEHVKDIILSPTSHMRI